MDLPRHNKVRSVPAGRRAFTLVELLVVVAIVVVLFGVRLPALAAGKTRSKSAQCMNNARQLSLAWLMYAADNHDYFLSSSGAATGFAGNNYSWALSTMNFDLNNRANYDPAVDIMQRPMWNYNRNADIYRCPADPSTVTVNGTAIPRTRSYSMNWFLGGFAGNPGSGSPWGPNFPYYTKLTDFADPVRSPGPAGTFLFIEERFDLINLGNFATDMTGYPQAGKPAAPATYVWLDMPAFYHSFASVISFVDGHVDIHRWQGDAADTLPAGAINGATFPAPNSADVAWMQNVSARPH